jgi:hypothetical protein
MWRAWGQALTIDEADSYLSHASQRTLGFPGANNHVLNTALMRISTKLFGVTQFTLRLPALLGAVVYIWAVVRLCRLLSVEWFVQVLLFLCMVFNPLVGDFLAAARGYGLALGFLMLGIVYAAERLFIPVRAQRSWLICAVASACFGISFAANFSFAFVDAVAMTFVFLGAWRSEGWGVRSWVWLKLMASVVPAVAVTWLMTRASILGFPREQLWYGVKSLRDTFRTVAAASLYHPGFGFLESVQPLILPFAVLASIVWAIGASRRLDWRLQFAACLTAIAAAALAIHWTLYQWKGLLLPQDRTAIYLPPLLTAAAGSILSIPGLSFPTRILRGVQVAAFVALAGYYLSCFRTDHFKEWYWDGETNRTYAMLTCFNREYGVRDITSIWMYVSPLKVYQAGSRGREDSLAIVDWRDFHPSDTLVYVVNRIFDQSIVEEKKLKVIYEGPSDVAIGVTPELAEKLRPSACLEATGVRLP